MGKPKVFTNEAWRALSGDPLKTLTVTRVSGSGPVSRGDRYRVELDGVFIGHVRSESRNGWSIHYADGRVGNVSRPWSGTLDRVVWTLVPPS